MHSKPVLVTGSTGYVGGRLVPQLLSSGFRVRVLGRSISKLEAKPWAADPRVEKVQADVLDCESLVHATKGCWAAFYLVHSMNPQSKNFAQSDRKAAQNMVRAADRARLERVIYLGGLGAQGSSLSEHLQSRAEVARILRSGPVPTTFLRAAMILGSGSASFEILRYLVERLPVMLTPRWVRNPVQPIAIRNVLNYLRGCLEQEDTTGQVFDIGGPDILTYGQLMRIYAKEAGLSRRLIVPLPVLTPRLSSYWIHLVTPVPSYIARPLAEGLRNPVVCQEDRIKEIIPQELISCQTAIRLSLDRARDHCIETCWSDAGAIPIPEWLHCGDAPYAGGSVMESGYNIFLRAAPDEVWSVVTTLGGLTGYYFGDFLWKLRGEMDRLLGGIGLRRGRRHPARLRSGDALDFFRVLDAKAPSLLRLLVEMKLPGEAILEFRVKSAEQGITELQMLTKYVPRGLLGLAYWYMIYPFHRVVFRGMLEGMANAVKKPILQGPDHFSPRRPYICHVEKSGSY
jgi:uncharacterized protein YbjT (DUF2867 family)